MNRLKIILAVAFLFSGLQVFSQDETGIPNETGFRMTDLHAAHIGDRIMDGVNEAYLTGVSEGSLAKMSETSLAHAPHVMMAMSDMDYQRELLHIRNSLMKYRREKLTGIWLTIGGGFVYGLSVGLYQADVLDEDGAAVVLITGGLMGISGYILQLTSNRWLKQAYLGPTRSGIGLGMNF